MIYRFWHEQTRQGFWVTSVFICCLIALFELAGLLRPFRFVGEQISLPFLQLSSQIVSTVELPYQVVVTNYHSYQKIQDLELRYSELAAQVGEIDTLKTENKELKLLLEATVSGQKEPSTITSIIGYGQPLIAKNKNSLIEEGNMVLIAQTLVGVVGKVGDTQAEVRLLHLVGSPPLLGRTESNVTGIIAGDGRHVILREIPVETDIKVGEKIYTVGQAGIRANLFVGRVQSIMRSSGEPTQTAIIDQGVSFYEAHVAEVKQ
jgi:cell shape-determining protein MreC